MQRHPNSYLLSSIFYLLDVTLSALAVGESVPDVFAHGAIDERKELVGQTMLALGRIGLNLAGDPAQNLRVGIAESDQEIPVGNADHQVARHCTGPPGQDIGEQQARGVVTV